MNNNMHDHTKQISSEGSGILLFLNETFILNQIHVCAMQTIIVIILKKKKSDSL